MPIFVVFGWEAAQVGGTSVDAEETGQTTQPDPHRPGCQLKRPKRIKMFLGTWKDAMVPEPLRKNILDRDSNPMLKNSSTMHLLKKKTTISELHDDASWKHCNSVFDYIG